MNDYYYFTDFGLRVHAFNPADPERVLCGQVKMRTGSRREGLRYTTVCSDVTCEKCCRQMLRLLKEGST